MYDADGRVIDKNGSLATVNMPAAVSTASYYPTDQVETWNGTSSNINDASNITLDPANSLTLTWTARNQLSTASTGATEAYDGLGRRESSSGTATLNFEYDGSQMIGWNSTTAGAYNFTTMPGGGPLAGSYTAGGTTTTWVPLLDADGSTLGLVNAANVDSPPVTTYTYDPAGNPTVSGTANDWPFLYQGMEKEYTDPSTYYYSGGGQFYSPQLVRSLSETSATSTSGSNSGPAGNAIARPSGSGGVPTAVGDAGIAAAASSASNLALTGILAVLEPKIFAAAWAAGAIPGIIVTAAFGLFDIFDAIFGGGDSAPPTPRQLLHGRHPLYPVILAVPPGLIPNQESAAPKLPCDGRPLAPDAGSFPGIDAPFPGFNYCGSGDYGGEPKNPTDACCQAHDCAYANAGLSGANVNSSHPGEGAGPAQRQADANLCQCVRGVPAGVNGGSYLRQIQTGIGYLFCYPQ